MDVRRRGEYTSKVFTTPMKEKGIEVLQSIPHAHQQNSHTEKLIRMLREKAETMRLLSRWFILYYRVDCSNLT